MPCRKPALFLCLNGDGNCPGKERDGKTETLVQIPFRLQATINVLEDLRMKRVPKPVFFIVALLILFVGSVSYTHLDVSKRQPRRTWKRNKTGNHGDKRLRSHHIHHTGTVEGKRTVNTIGDNKDRGQLYSGTYIGFQQ